MRAKTANMGTTPRRVAVIAYDGLSMFEFAVACEVFGPSAGEWVGVPWYELVVCSDRPTVRFENGMSVSVAARLTAARRADTIVLPPCDDPTSVSDAVLTAVRRAHARGARIISLCTGAFVLARTGLLDGRRAVTHWDECEGFAAQFPAVTLDPEVLYVDEGDILTSAGVAASIDLCLYLVRRDHGADVATMLARHLVVPPHREGGQAQYIDHPIPEADGADPMSDTLTWMSGHLDRDLTIGELADRAAMSPRSFARHFVATTGATPYQWLLRQRIHEAQRLLERSDLPVEVIAERVGLGNPANLRKHFRRQLDTSPQSYRRTFRSAPPAEPLADMARSKA
jgi:transcriptional regulator GlxA family with amidase domain